MTDAAIALRMEAGTAGSDQPPKFGPNIPFGGARQPGMAVECAEEGLAEFTQIHIVNEARWPGGCCRPDIERPADLASGLPHGAGPCRTRHDKEAIGRNV